LLLGVNCFLSSHGKPISRCFPSGVMCTLCLFSVTFPSPKTELALDGLLAILFSFGNCKIVSNPFLQFLDWPESHFRFASSLSSLWIPFPIPERWASRVYSSRRGDESIPLTVDHNVIQLSSNC
jgi:hypothetical protein